MEKKFFNIGIIDWIYFLAISVTSLLLVVSSKGYFAALIVFAITVIRLRGVRTPFSLKLFAIYVLWVGVTTIINAAVSGSSMVYGLSTTLAAALLSISMLAVGVVLDSDKKKSLLNVFTFFFGAFAFTMSLCGIYCLITLKPVVILNLEIATLLVERGVSYAQILGTHRNITAAWMMIAFFLMLYQWFACRRKLWRIPIGICAVIIFAEIGLQHCRSVTVASSVGLGMFAALMIMEHRPSKLGLKQLICMLLAGVLVMGVSYKVFDACDDGLKLIRARIELVAEAEKAVDKPEQIVADGASADQSAINEALAEAPAEQATEKTPEAENTMGEDTRDFWNDLSTFTSRTSIWKSILKAVGSSPKAFILGNVESNLTYTLHYEADLSFRAAHGHNAFFHALFVFGLPGALLLLAFIILQLKLLIQVYFAHSNGISLQNKLLVLPLAALLLYGLLEPLFSTFTPVSNCCFCLIAGILLSEWKESKKT